MDIKWKYAKPLKSDELIHEFEKKYNYTFPDDFIECIMHYNNGRPSNNNFQVKKTSKTIKKLLSFDKKAKESIWQMNEWGNEIPNNQYIIFAIDDSGNLICFSKLDNSIKFIDTEILKVDDIASDFEEFTNLLY